MTHTFRFCVLICITVVLISASAGPVSAALVPQITGLSPSGGPISGGTVVTITGSGFTGTKDVEFAEKSGTALKIINDSQLTIVTPPNPEGTVLVSIYNGAGVGSSTGPSTRYDYDEFPYPRLSGVSPASGPAAGFDLVTITGSGFTGTEYVWFGEKSVIDLNVIDDSHLTVRTPASSPGSVPISIKNAHGAGRLSEPAVLYLYEFSLPVLTNISPPSGSVDGGNVITITGTGFSGTKDVLFGGKPGTGLNLVNDSQLTIITPPNPEGTVAISVINPAGTGGSLGSETMFRYKVPVPKLTGISPSSGSIEGGTVVTITGSWFNGTKDVRFGGKSGTGLNIIDNSHLTIITPPSSPGTIPISISNKAGVGGSLGPVTLFRYFISPTMTTSTTETPIPVQGHSNEGDNSPALSFPATSPPLTAATATAEARTNNTPGFEAIAGLSALGALILLRKTPP